MARAISLHVGVNVVGSAGPRSTPLEGCVNDARAMHNLPELGNFDRREILLDGAATLNTVVARITQAATDLEPGGIFVFTFAGHGSYIGDESRDEPDRRDETLVLFDLMLSDDVLGRDLWPTFKPNTRVLMISDSCHSGTVSTVPSLTAEAAINNKPFSMSSRLSSRSTRSSEFDRDRRIRRTISESSRVRHLSDNKDFYDRMLRGLPANPTINASVILLAACLDDETTPDGNPRGPFTQALLDSLRDQNPPMNYDELIADITSRLRRAGLAQTPFISPAGQPNPAFRGQRPFTI